VFKENSRLLKLAVLAIFALRALVSSPAAQPLPTQEYLVYVVCESADKIALVRFGPQGARLDHELATGLMPIDIDGPHGIAVSPDKRFYYVSLAHGRPFGSVWKYMAKNDLVVGRVTLGMFPATMDVTPDGNFVYVVNFNLHGDMVPSSVSVIVAAEMIELVRVPTCKMPHGSRINPQGTKHYSVCMMDDMLVEIDTRTLQVSRHFVLTKGREEGIRGAPDPHSPPEIISCVPTWAQPSSDGSSVYVACNKSDEIVEVDTKTWKITRRLPAGPGVYNLAVTKDGLLIGTNKRGQSVSVFDLKTGRELARLATKRNVVHGVVVSSDDRYAFVSVEGIGAEPGTVEIIDLKMLQTVATVDVGEQAAGIDFLRIEPAGAAAGRQ